MTLPHTLQDIVRELHHQGWEHLFDRIGKVALLPGLEASKLIQKKSQVIATSGSAQHFHNKTIPNAESPQLWVHAVHKPTLVLGSTQSEDLLDHKAAAQRGFEVAKRRSGGGLVVIHPNDTVWIDVVLPASHHLWETDIGKAFMWVGQAWAQSLADVGIDNASIHQGPASNPELARVLCFGSVGAGEVSVDGHKVVGLSQKRVRNGARFQTIAVNPWDPTELAGLLADEHQQLITDVKVGIEFDTKALLAAAIANLSDALETASS